MNQRGMTFQRFNAEVLHQRMAGVASWAAFSARWRARQGLPLLHAMDVQYLSPQDFCSGTGRPLPPAEQRRLFRAYVESAVQVCVQMAAHSEVTMTDTGSRRDMDGNSGNIAYIRATGFIRSFDLRPDFQYGRCDLPSYDPENIAPTHPYGVPTTSSTFVPCWLAGMDEDEDGDESWIPAVGAAAADGEWFS